MTEITLQNGSLAIIDKENINWLSKYKWYLDKDGYVFCTRPTRRMHRLIIGANPGQLVDHINGNKIDNRKENLRICNYNQNAANRKKQKNNSSGFKGVDYFPYRTSYKKWRAGIRGDLIGYFENKIDAAKAYDKAALKIFGEFARLNFGEK